MRSVPRVLLPLVLCLACLPAAAQAPVERVREGNRISEGVPEIPPELRAKLERYQNTRGAEVAGWTREGCLLVGTRFAETVQTHRVCQPMGMREQLTFYREPVTGVAAAPAASGRDGFVYAKDVGGNEFSQLHWFDLASRQTTLLTDGRRTQNTGARFSRDGRWLAYASTSRNGTDTDVWVRDMQAGTARAVVAPGGSWRALDFAPDGKSLLVMRNVSVNDTRPGTVDLATGTLTLFPVDGGTAAITHMRHAPGGGVLYVSDEPVGGVAQEFRTLRHHVPGRPVRVITGDVDWDVEALEVSDDGRHIAFVVNEDGIARLDVRRWPSLERVALPALPIGQVGGLAFSPDGGRLAVTVNGATSPADAYVVDLGARTLDRWTRSEVGGLDASRFIAPTLVRFPTFDKVDGVPRTIPAFYYRPANARAGARVPVVISIHGGPEAQAFPIFNPTFQFLANELGIAVLVPNVRGSTGYGRTFVNLDNAKLREDAVRDIGALLDWIGTREELDAARVGVVGGSYGGYMVLASLVHYSERIRAGINVVGISHFGTFLRNTEGYRRDLRRVEYGDERDPAIAALFERISPLNNAARIRSPLFVAHGVNDPRVPYTEAEQIVRAVRGNGTPVWLLMFDDEGHGFRKKANADHFGAASVLFWQQHLLGAAP